MKNCTYLDMIRKKKKVGIRVTLIRYMKLKTIDRLHIA